MIRLSVLVLVSSTIAAHYLYGAKLQALFLVFILVFNSLLLLSSFASFDSAKQRETSPFDLLLFLFPLIWILGKSIVNADLLFVDYLPSIYLIVCATFVSPSKAYSSFFRLFAFIRSNSLALSLVYFTSSLLFKIYPLSITAPSLFATPFFLFPILLDASLRRISSILSLLFVFLGLVLSLKQTPILAAAIALLTLYSPLLLRSIVRLGRLRISKNTIASVGIFIPLGVLLIAFVAFSRGLLVPSQYYDAYSSLSYHGHGNILLTLNTLSSGRTCDLFHYVNFLLTSNPLLVLFGSSQSLASMPASFECINSFGLDVDGITVHSRDYFHSSLLDLLYDYGALGALPFAIFLARPLVLFLRSWGFFLSARPETRSIFLCFVNSIVLNSFALNLRFDFSLFLLALATIGSVGSVASPSSTHACAE